MLAIFLAALESTVVALAMPTVVAKLGGLEIYSWVFSGYMLTQTITMPLWGRFSDIYGRRSVYLVGLTTFLLGSVLSGAAQDMIQLIRVSNASREGAGSLMTLGYTVVGGFSASSAGPSSRAIWPASGSGFDAGPPLGGVLTDHVSWRSVFYMNVPPGLVAMALLATALAGVPRPERRPVIDYAGVALFTAGVSALLWAPSRRVGRAPGRGSR